MLDVSPSLAFTDVLLAVEAVGPEVDVVHTSTGSTTASLVHFFLHFAVVETSVGISMPLRWRQPNSDHSSKSPACRALRLAKKNSRRRASRRSRWRATVMARPRSIRCSMHSASLHAGSAHNAHGFTAATLRTISGRSIESRSYEARMRSAMVPRNFLIRASSIVRRPSRTLPLRAALRLWPARTECGSGGGPLR